jgi:hypothetical protein
MALIRKHLLARRWLACWLLAVALLTRMIVPTGFMPVLANGTVTMQLCTGHGTVEVNLPAPSGKQTPVTKADMPCPFAGLAMPGLAGADPLLLAIAIAFILALGFAPVHLPRAYAPPRLRPPLRGPPLPR